jgi:Xaa-Pro aminopeptidase
MLRLLLSAWIIVSFSMHDAVGYADDGARFFAARRQALMKRIEGSLAVLEGAPDSRAYIRFRQDNNFYYLTGVEIPNALLLLDASKDRTLLFLPSRDEKKEKWDGPSLYPGPDAGRQTGIDEVLDMACFKDELEKHKKNVRAAYISFSPYETAATSRDRAFEHDTARQNDSWDGRQSREASFERNLRASLGQKVAIKDLSPILDDMRRVKDAQEIQFLRESGRIGALGIIEAIRSAKPGMYEYQLAALADFMFRWHGASGPAFFPIVGSGPNSCFVHYEANNRKTEAGDIIVMDFGADYRYYESDITRTFPSSGHFSEEQARIYQIVLDAQKAGLDRVRPGATFFEVHEAARRVLARFGLDDYLTHGVSHYVGMSVHDVGKSEPFEPGVVITVEPGVYIPAKNLGIRIEDTVLVTKDGCEVLTRDVPKDISEIERLMSEKGFIEGMKREPEAGMNAR